MSVIFFNLFFWFIFPMTEFEIASILNFPIGESSGILRTSPISFRNESSGILVTSLVSYEAYCRQVKSLTNVGKK